MKFYAHSNDQEKKFWQPLIDHLTQTGDRAAGFLNEPIASELARMSGILHDLGKYSKEFQARLEGSSARVEHSIAGAQLLKEVSSNDPFESFLGCLVGHCIVGHHAGLPDTGSVTDLSTDSTFYGRMKRPAKQLFFENELRLPIKLPTRFGIEPIHLEGVTRSDSMALSASFLTRMIFSALVDADFLDTEEFMKADFSQRGGFDDLKTLREKLNRKLAEFGVATNDLNRWRSEILEASRANAIERKGFYSLSVPTGGGKTLSSMAFALDHAINHGLKRVIYVIPYTSIIEQNARVFKDILGEENVLEHHSNFDVNTTPVDDSGEKSRDKLKLASENWDVPIVVTTNVQFFESIYAARGSKCRKNHNITNSVIVLDEAQMLPTGFMRPILLALDELVTNYGSTVVISTATQPNLEQIHPRLTAAKEMVPHQLSDRFRYQRNTIEYIGEQSREELSEKLNQHSQVLCVVNTRRYAREIYDLMPKGSSVYLSTYLCPKHRTSILSSVSHQLRAGNECRVISTQLVEAGVDLDFEVGFRALAGLDSIIQAAGRVNREGKRPEGKVNVFDVDAETKKRTPASIRQKAEITRMILERFSNTGYIEQAVGSYYRDLYGVTSKEEFDLIGVLKQFTVEQKNGEKMELNPDFRFRTVAENFQLIDSPTTPLIIPWDQEAEALIQKLRVDKYPRRFARKLQPYVVGVFNHELARLMGRGAIITEGEVFYVLSDLSYYDQITGLNVPDDSGGNAIIL